MTQGDSGRRPVREIMTSQIVMVSPQDPARDIARIMRDDNVGMVLVVEDGRLVGVISDRQLAMACLANGLDVERCRAQDVMTPDPVTVSPDASEGEAIGLIGRHRVRRLPVIEGGTVVGIVSVADLVKDLENCPECIADLAKELGKAA